MEGKQITIQEPEQLRTRLLSSKDIRNDLLVCNSLLLDQECAAYSIAVSGVDGRV
jgi:hypothetical protein